jgi:excinuclease UvrABC nuclease subunit
VIYAENGDVIYVGKASLGASLGSRLAVHERDKHPKWEGARLVQMIEVSEAFEAPSLEEYMLGRLATRLNRIGINMKAI